VAVHRCIGMDGTRLLEFLTQNADQDVQQRAKDLHLQHFSAGDAVWDIVAGKNAGVPSIGVLSGGVSREELGNA
jgi:phosphoglycolate phosphatase-like HAD superfamily hydrolase